MTKFTSAKLKKKEKKKEKEKQIFRPGWIIL